MEVLFNSMQPEIIIDMNVAFYISLNRKLFWLNRQNKSDRTLCFLSLRNSLKVLTCISEEVIRLVTQTLDIVFSMENKRVILSV